MINVYTWCCCCCGRFDSGCLWPYARWRDDYARAPLLFIQCPIYPCISSSIGYHVWSCAGLIAGRQDYRSHNISTCPLESIGGARWREPVVRSGRSRRRRNTCSPIVLRLKGNRTHNNWVLLSYVVVQRCRCCGQIPRLWAADERGDTAIPSSLCESGLMNSHFAAPKILIKSCSAICWRAFMDYW